jgi:hypothetical protein
MLLNKNKEKSLDILKKDFKLLKFTVNKLFNFGDLDSEYQDINSSFGNIYCPFHPYEGKGKNVSSPAAKMYEDETQGIQVIHCFNSHRTYTAFDMLEKVLEKDAYQFLLDNVDVNTLIEIVDSYIKGYIDLNNDILEQKINYVDNLYEEVDCNLVDYIERLYVGN